MPMFYDVSRIRVFSKIANSDVMQRKHFCWLVTVFISSKDSFSIIFLFKLPFLYVFVFMKQHE